MTPELDLLLACARLRLEPEDRERSRAAIAKGVDQDRLLQLADLHGLLPLLRVHVKRGDVPVSPTTRERLGARAEAMVVRNLQLSRELVILMRLCAQHAVPVIPLKGVVLAHQIYGDVGLRRVADIDLLFRDQDLARVIQLFEAQGYERAPDESSPDDDVEQRNAHHVSVVHVQKEIRIELHRCLLRPRARGRWDFDVIAPRVGHIPFMGQLVPAFTPEDLLVYLCEHGAEHAWIRLEWLVAIAELVRSGKVRDWGRVMQWAEELGTARRVRAALLLADEWLGLHVPAAVPTRDRSADAANRIVRRRLLADSFQMRETPAERFGYLFLTDQSAGRRLQRCWTTVLTPSAADVEVLPLPKPLFPLYGVLRPIRLVIRRIRRGL